MTDGSGVDLPSLYRRRFPDADAADRTRIWVELARYLRRFVPAHGTVLDLACDRGHFINNVAAAERWAVDIRDVRAFLDPAVHFVQMNGLDIASRLRPASFDVVFISNYLEHLPSSEAVVEQLRAVHDCLKPGARVIILQPNIRLVGGRYWDFLDHKVALTERSLNEAARQAGFDPEKIVTRFLPYTTTGRLPRHPLLVRAYLAVPILWWVFGRQTLYIGRRPESAESSLEVNFRTAT